MTLDISALTRLKEMRTQWKKAKDQWDGIRMKQCEFIAADIKKGNRTFIYPDDASPKEEQSSDHHEEE